MQSIKSRITNLEQNSQRHNYVVVIVHPWETREQALARADLHPQQPVILVDRSCGEGPSVPPSTCKVLSEC